LVDSSFIPFTKYSKHGRFSYFYTMKGTLWLIPNTLDDGDPKRSLPSSVLEQVGLLRYFIVENEKSARRFLVRAGMKQLLEEIEFGLLDEHTKDEELEPLILPVLKGCDAGLLSESGCPGVADPGANIIRQAHASGIRVRPMVGPSSVIMSVMAGGLNGQRFAFHGYLPAKPQDRVRKIREIENRSKMNQETQVFIEAPYRNRQMLNDLINNLSPDTLLSVSVDLTTEQELIKTARVWEWAKFDTDLNKRLAVFSILKT
jgi:16S rRNA (cytidine1402-2'-O)-methyltransferase